VGKVDSNCADENTKSKRVYVLRLPEARMIGRLEAESDLTYIGSALKGFYPRPTLPYLWALNHSTRCRRATKLCTGAAGAYIDFDICNRRTATPGPLGVGQSRGKQSP
jgi:hypothetical protein